MSIRTKLFTSASLVAMLAAGAAHAAADGVFVNGAAAVGPLDYTTTEIMGDTNGPVIHVIGSTTTANITVGGTDAADRGSIDANFTNPDSTNSGTAITVDNGGNLILNNQNGGITAGMDHAIYVNNGGNIEISVGGTQPDLTDVDAAKRAQIFQWDDIGTGEKSAIYIDGADSVGLTLKGGSWVGAYTTDDKNISSGAGAIKITGNIEQASTITLQHNSRMGRTGSNQSPSSEGIAIDLSGSTGGGFTIDLQAGAEVFGDILLSTSVNDTVKIDIAKGASVATNIDSQIINADGKGNVVFHGGASLDYNGNSGDVYRGRLGTNIAALNSVSVQGEYTVLNVNSANIYANNITVGDQAATLNLNGTSTIQDVTAIDISGDGAALTLNDTASVSAPADGTLTVTVSGANATLDLSEQASVTGNVIISGDDAGVILANTASITGNVTLSHEDALLTLNTTNANGGVSGTIKASTDGLGTVKLTAITGGNTLSAVGEEGKSIKKLTLDGATGAGDITLGATYAKAILIGESKNAATVIANGKLTGDVAINNGSTLTIKDSYSGVISTQDDSGKLVFDKTGGGTITSGGNIKNNSNSLASVTVKEGTTLSLGHLLAANDVQVDGTLIQTAGTITGAVELTEEDSAISLSENGVTGVIEAKEDGFGTVTLNGTTVNAAIGTDTHAIKALIVGEGDSTSASNIYTTDGTTIDADGSFELTGSVEVGGIVTNSGTFTFADAKFLSKFTNNNDAIANSDGTDFAGGFQNYGTLNLEGDITFGADSSNEADASIVLTGNASLESSTSTFTNKGVLDLSEYDLTITAGTDVVINGGSTIKTLLTSNGGSSMAEASTDLGSLKIYEDVEFAGTGKVTITPRKDEGVTLTGNTYYLLADANDNYVWDVDLITVTKTGNIRWEVVADDTTGNLYLKAMMVTDSGLTPSASSVAGAINNYTGNNAAIQSLMTVLGGLTTEETEQLAQQLMASPNGSVVLGTIGTNNQISGVIGGRMGQNRTQVASATKSGVAAGEVRRGSDVWIQTFGSHFDQDRRDGIDGYDGETYGVVAGFETAVAKNVSVGVSFAYASTDISDKGARSGSSTDIDSYVGSVYASYQGSPWFIDATASVGRNNNETVRVVDLGGQKERPEGDFSSMQYSAKLIGGYPINLGGAVLTPSVGVTATWLNAESYKETNGATTALEVDEQDYHQYGSVLGLKLAKTFVDGKSRYTPEIEMAWTHDFGDSDLSSSSSFVADNSVRFRTQGPDADRDSFQIGGGMTFVHDDTYSLAAQYVYDWRDSYDAHTALVEARLKF